MENYNYGLKIKDRFVIPGDTIKITKTDGNSNLAHLFRKGIIDEAILTFTKHEKYNTLMIDAILRKESKKITNAQAFEYDQDTIDDIPERARKEYHPKPFEINIAFADEIEQSDAEYITQPNS